MSSRVDAAQFWLDLIPVGHFFARIFALIVVIRYRRISPATSLLIGGLAGMIAGQVLSFAVFRPISGSSVFARFGEGLFLLPSLLGLAAWIAFAAGLALVFRDLHRRVALPVLKEPVDDFL